MVDLQQKRNPLIPSSSEKDFEIPENEAAIVLDINDHAVAGYDRKVYIGKVLKVNDSDANLDEIWTDFENILYVVPVPAQVKRGKTFETFVLENMMKKISVWKNKNCLFFLVLYCTRYSVRFSFICKTITSLEIETDIMQ